MTDDFDFEAAETDLSTADMIYGNADEIAESLNAAITAAMTFGPHVAQQMVNEIDSQVPLMKEINGHRPGNAAEYEALRERYFGTDEAAAKSVDAMAEGIKVGQKWLYGFLANHGLDAITLYVPVIDQSRVRKWSFGRMSTLRAHGAFDEPVRMAGTIKIPSQDEDQHRSTTEPDEPHGYL